MKFQHKRSNVLRGRIDRNTPPAAKEPAPEKTEYGELAVNYNAEDPVLFIKDSLDNIVRIAGRNSVGNRPEDITGFPDLNDGNGENLDKRYVNTVGDTMTGQLGLPGGGGNTQALQKQEIETLISRAVSAQGICDDCFTWCEPKPSGCPPKPARSGGKSKCK